MPKQSKVKRKPRHTQRNVQLSSERRKIQARDVIIDFIDTFVSCFAFISFFFFFFGCARRKLEDPDQGLFEDSGLWMLPCSDQLFRYVWKKYTYAPRWEHLVCACPKWTYSGSCALSVAQFCSSVHFLVLDTVYYGGQHVFS